ncbi:unnamed protein product [Spodoptera exigua]|nr:unnamed protein product [Spodoptera exigua]
MGRFGSGSGGVIYIGGNNAYKSFYVLLLMVVYWTLDVLHPSALAIMPIGISCVMSGVGMSFISEIYIRNDLLDCIGVMMIIIAIENSMVHRRIAIKVLLVFGCSHYRWVSSKFIKLSEKQLKNQIDMNKSDMATMMGSQTNQIFKVYCETIFPLGPKIEFPHFMLLNLPGVLVMETLLYMWMNFAFLGMFSLEYQNSNYTYGGELNVQVYTLLILVTPQPGSSNLFESLRDSEMLLEFEKFLLIFKGLPASALVFIVVLFCKILTEFASNFSVVYALLPSIAKVSISGESANLRGWLSRRNTYHGLAINRRETTTVFPEVESKADNTFGAESTSILRVFMGRYDIGKK